MISMQLFVQGDVDKHYFSVPNEIDKVKKILTAQHSGLNKVMLDTLLRSLLGMKVCNSGNDINSLGMYFPALITKA